MDQHEVVTSTLTEVEQHVLIICRKHTRWAHSGPSREELLRKTVEKFGGSPDDVTRALDSLVSRAWLELDSNEAHVTLCDRAVPVAWQLDHAESQVEFGKWLCAFEQSATYAEFCRRVYDTPFAQFNMVDHEQLTELMKRIQLTPEHRVLDLGCGVGTQSEYLSDTTGAKFLGIDFSAAAVARAVARTAAKRDRLDFRVSDLDVFELPGRDFTHVLSFDTLYFVDDLENTLKRAFASLRRGGQFAAFYSEMQREGESNEILNPSSTRLAQALQKLGCAFDWVDFTESERLLWTRYLEAALSLRAQFEAEGNGQFTEGLEEEARGVLQKCKERQTRRCLYLAIVGD